jgi:hypothetical protein
MGSSPTSLSFGSVTLGSNQSLSETVTNTGGSSVTISQVGISGSRFSLSGITAPVTLTPGQSASFSVSFAPTSAGSASGYVTITSTRTAEPFVTGGPFRRAPGSAGLYGRGQSKATGWQGNRPARQ